MCIDYRRNKFSAGLAGAAALLLAILVTPRSALLYAQEDEFTETPSVAADDSAAAWEPTTDAPEDADESSVLDLPQVVAVGHDAITAASADSSDPSLSDDQPDGQAQDQSQDQSDDLVDYAAQGAVANEAPGSSALIIVPRAGLAPVSRITSYAIIGGNRAAPAWSGNGMSRPWTAGPIFRTSPMLTTPRGSHVIMGGWWHRAR